MNFLTWPAGSQTPSWLTDRMLVKISVLDRYRVKSAHLGLKLVPFTKVLSYTLTLLKVNNYQERKAWCRNVKN